MNIGSMKFFHKYMKDFAVLIEEVPAFEFEGAVKSIEKCKKLGGKLVFVGNGGSAAISSHIAVDFTKNCKIRSINFNEADLLTCFSNDYGYENWVVEALKAYIDKVDLVVLISSSGNSANIVNAADYCVLHSQDLITFSGFSDKNKIRNKGKYNFWIDAHDYNFVEMVHHVWLVALVDYFAAQAVLE